MPQDGLLRVPNLLFSIKVGVNLLASSFFRTVTGF